MYEVTVQSFYMDNEAGVKVSLLSNEAECCCDVVDLAFGCLLGVGFHKNNILDAFELLLKEHGRMKK